MEIISPSFPPYRPKPKVNYEEGSTTESNLYSSMRWALTEVDNTPTYLGKWGHRMLAWVADNDQGEAEPALYLVAGDAVDGGSFVSDVFVSTETREMRALFLVVFLFSIVPLVPLDQEYEGRSWRTEATKGYDWVKADSLPSASLYTSVVQVTPSQMHHWLPQNVGRPQRHDNILVLC